LETLAAQVTDGFGGQWDAGPTAPCEPTEHSWGDGLAKTEGVACGEGGGWVRSPVGRSIVRTSAMDRRGSSLTSAVAACAVAFHGLVGSLVSTGAGLGAASVSTPPWLNLACALACALA
jgi:hypothetical protein